MSDSLVKLGLLLLGTAVLFSIVATPGTSAGAPSQTNDGLLWLVVVLVVALGFVGRRWLHRRDAGAKAPRRWSRRKRALPPAPEPPQREG